ncbi:MAG: flagellar brake protein [Gallionella sp.]
MEKDITLKVKIFSGSSDEKYCITSAKEIGFVLRNIADKGSRVALYFGNANDFILTTILGVDSQGLWLEQSKDQVKNQEILAAHDFVIVAAHNNVKVQFSLDKLTLAAYQDYQAFRLALPEKLFRLQRREYFRLMTPATHPLKCVIENKYQNREQPREVTIMDISGGGVALTCEESDTELLPGEVHPNCHIDLPEFGTISGTIVVKNLAVLTDGNGRSFKRAGCELQGMDSNSTVLLQRYVLHLQRNK